MSSLLQGTGLSLPTLSWYFLAVLAMGNGFLWWDRMQVEAKKIKHLNRKRVRQCEVIATTSPEWPGQLGPGMDEPGLQEAKGQSLV